MAGPAAIREAQALEQRAAWLRRLAAETRESEIRDRLVAAVSPPDGEPDLLTAALLIAALDHDELDVDLYRTEVEELARELRERLRDEMPGGEKLAELHRLMFEDKGYHGSRTNYYSAANSHLNAVIDDREGLPITLSVLYMEIARRAGLKVEGVGLPGHFITRFIPAEGEPRLVDVYDRGAFLTREQALARVVANGGTWDESLLDAVSARQIVVRMLRNLLSTSKPQENPDRALRYVNALLAVEPESISDRLFRAVVSYDTNRLEEGLADVDMVKARHPEGIDLNRVHQLRSAIQEKLNALKPAGE
jgi:regulator of sirC expression with transglutaminase-like and TPR domain